VFLAGQASAGTEYQVRGYAGENYCCAESSFYRAVSCQQEQQCQYQQQECQNR